MQIFSEKIHTAGLFYAHSSLDVDRQLKLVTVESVNIFS